MHFVVALLGFIVGASSGAAGDPLLGALAGALIASLLFRLGRARSDIATLTRRLDAVERRQKAIPVAAHVDQPASAATAMPPPASIDETEERPAARETAQPEPDVVVRERIAGTAPEPSTLEHLIDVAKRWLTTGNVPVKVGIIILFFGVAFLLRYAIENSVVNIPIGMRYLFVAAFSAVLLWLGWRMRETHRVYALSLQGGGIGILFLVVFAAFRLHGLLPPVLAFSTLVLLTAAAGFLAVKQESRALAILGTSGGFLAPLLVSTGSGNHVALFSYYLILNGAVLGVAWVRAWRELNVIGFVFTFGVGTIWGLQYYVPEKFETTAPFLALFFVFYTAIAILFAFRSKPALRGYVDGTLVFGTPTIAFALQSQMLRGSEYGLAISAGVVAMFYAALTAWLWRRRDSRFDLLRQSFMALAVAFATIAVPLAVDDRWTAIAWALEGAALVWVGVRQSTSLAKAAGSALSIASGAAFVRYGWQHDPGSAVLNGNFAGAALIGVAAILSGWLLRDDNRVRQWQVLASAGLFLWGVLWWFAAGTREILDHVAGTNELHALMMFSAASFALMAFAGRFYAWQTCRNTTLAALPLLAASGFMYLVEHDHLLVGAGIVGWAMAVAAHFYVLRAYGQGRPISWWHTGGALLLAALLGYEVYWQIDERVINQVWAFTGSMLAIGAVAALLLWKQGSRRWPLCDHSDAYYLASLVLTAVYLFFVHVVLVNDPGDPMPMPYIPLLNPFDVLSIAALALLWGVIGGGDRLGIGIHDDNRALLATWGGSAFLLATLALMRTVHHLAGIDWDSEAMMNSTLLQTSLTIFWAALGLGGMLLGTRLSRRNIWLVGVGLMAIVVLKLAVIDLSNTGTIARIVSFLGVGVMLLVVGYFSPVPPRSEQAENA